MPFAIPYVSPPVEGGVDRNVVERSREIYQSFVSPPVEGGVDRNEWETFVERRYIRECRRPSRAAWIETNLVDLQLETLAVVSPPVEGGVDRNVVSCAAANSTVAVSPPVEGGVDRDRLSIAATAVAHEGCRRPSRAAWIETSRSSPRPVGRSGVAARRGRRGSKRRSRAGGDGPHGLPPDRHTRPFARKRAVPAVE